MKRNSLRAACGRLAGPLRMLPVAAALVLANCGNSGGGAGAAGVEDVAGAGDTWREFSGERAFAHVRQMVEFGPRPSGSQALETTRQYLEEKLVEAGWSVQRQVFEDHTPKGPVTFANLRARFAVDGEDPWARGVLTLAGSHYDTKWFDGITFVGANDAGSSTGVLLEIARAAATRPAFARKLELVFFDGEEAVVQFTASDGLYGSRYYARQLRYVEKSLWPRYLVLFDMVGDSDLRIEIPTNGSSALRLAAFAAAADLGYGDHFGLYPGEILDDHVPLAAVGLEVTNLIDFSYRPWHTAADTLDKLSPDSLRIAGQTGLRLMEAHLPLR